MALRSVSPVIFRTQVQSSAAAEDLPPVQRRSLFWSQLSLFIGVRKRPIDRFASVDEDLWTRLDLGLRIWKACWVNSPRGFESRILRWLDKGKWEIVTSRPQAENLSWSQFWSQLACGCRASDPR
jgi:hypothetical protein